MEIKDKINFYKENIPDSVTILAVSKTKPLEDLEVAYNSGLRDFGENKVQELCEKEENFHKDVRWHFIGNLQKNKVKYLVNKTYLIHSVSSIELLKKIEGEFSKKNSVANVLIQINIGREESKGGILEEELEDIIKEVESCKNVKVNGIMVIIPKGEEKENRIYFKKTREIFEDLKSRDFKNIKMQTLSMGMTNDYKEAIEEGSNLVRIGSGIFGKRDYSLGGLKNEWCNE